MNWNILNLLRLIGYLHVQGDWMVTEEAAAFETPCESSSVAGYAEIGLA